MALTDCGEHIVDEKICDLLNELHEENQRLKKDLEKEIQAYKNLRIRESEVLSEYWKKDNGYLQARDVIQLIMRDLCVDLVL